MRFLSTSKDIAEALAALMEGSERIRWAVAWASTKAPPFEVLSESRHKIEQLTVGTHMYQTDPDFIAEFIEHPRAKFVMNPSGLFHPKLYYFESGERWDAVVGSANLTGAALTDNRNDEVAVHICSDDPNAEEVRTKILSTLDGYQNGKLSEAVSAETLEHYRRLWLRHRPKVAALTNTYGDERNGKKPAVKVKLMVESWQEFVGVLLGAAELEERLAVLDGCADYFKRFSRFEDIPTEGRRRVAGLDRTSDLDWLYFGSMRGAGTFQQAINKSPNGVSRALQVVPLTGQVTKDHYEGFCDIYCRAFERAALASASRLLAMKRPDYFVCLDSKNRRQLCKAFGIPQKVGLADYWVKVVEPLTDSIWWNAPEPKDPNEARLWRTRTAMLDVRFYEPE